MCSLKKQDSNNNEIRHLKMGSCLWTGPNIQQPYYQAVSAFTDQNLSFAYYEI